MKKFINTASLLTFLVVVLLDCGTAYFFKFAIKKIITGERSGTAILFAVMMAFALFIAIKVTIDQCKTGVEFHKDACVFNGIDSDNRFVYDDIKSVDIEKDEKISFIKNFTDRSGLLKIETREGRIHILNLGTLSRKRLLTIKKQISMRLHQNDTQ